MVNRETSSALGEFIKSRRYRLQPEDAGINTNPGRRRTPGLRREEVAYLANVSITYYTWLEQGRERNPSPEVLSSISQALQLDKDEKKYLFDLATYDPTSTYFSSNSEKLNAKFLQDLVNQLRYPSFIVNEVADVIAWNRGAELIVADFGGLPESERNIVLLPFLNMEYQKRMLNWEDFASYMTALSRASYVQHKDNPLYMERFERLKQNSEDFARMWDRHEIRQKNIVPVHYRLPTGQELAFTIHCAVAIDNNPGLHWCFLVPTPGSGTEEKLSLLLAQDTE
ncbi:helix-turn-helix transcriptional regulator [Alkalicoccobacillus porphyridii]|uniref:Helix-turn-helix domain-containing protein n=1 Tax=Alkalicoccobacillus porphyridii TaxID=2597270 RepID=A0A554A2K1_9BACI|nr:helix-turn-helix transcriptional regulator [Alkalicoccobacillus porphyridii]TSB47934.1 helix-turn-helix domain-containing protein [Alkalicoccobacillus porphyridii]